jgi:hypothetical protein
MSASLFYRGDIAFLDNLATHKLAGGTEEIEARMQWQLVCARSGDYGPIEQVFSKLKVLPRRVRHRGEVASRNSS